MLFITPSFFEFEPYKIANVTEIGDVANELSRFIGIYEKQCLLDLLGECLYKEVVDSLQFSGGKFDLKENATQEITDLVNGKSYEVTTNENDVYDTISWWEGCGCGCGNSDCKTRKWNGLVETDSFVIGTSLATSKRSFIADYIYYHYLLENRTITAGTGQQVLSGENSATVQNFSKRIDAWNRFILGAVNIRSNQTSLYRFLQENKSSYPTWKKNCNLKIKDKF
jgi:hypothetical protein